MEFLAAIEALAPIQALKASFYAYPLVNALHILSVGALVTSVLLLDARLLGGIGSLPVAAFALLTRRVAALAFSGAVASGALLFAVRARDYAATPLFLVKMGLILLAGINMIMLSRIAGRSMSEARGPVARAMLVGSMVLWLAILIVGRFLGFV